MTSLINPGQSQQRSFSRFIVPELVILSAQNVTRYQDFCSVPGVMEIRPKC